MKTQGLLFFSDHFILIVGLLIFVSLFVIFVTRVFSKHRREHYRELAAMPMQDEEIV